VDSSENSAATETILQVGISQLMSAHLHFLSCSNLLGCLQLVKVGACMLYIAGLLAIFSGLSYSAGVHELGAAGAEMCQFGNAFCDKPHYLLVAAGLAAAWGAFVSVL
jgi:hypothetical protein